MSKRRKINPEQLEAKLYAPYMRGALFFEGRRVAVCQHQHTSPEAAERCATQLLERRRRPRRKPQQQEVAA